MKRLPVKMFLPLLLLSGLSVAGEGDAPDRERSLERMGELNGIALACRQFDQTRRIKRALIDTLPKQRELGQAFDEDTNASYMAFVNSGRPCPSPAGFSAEVDRAIEALGKAYATSQ